MQTTPALYETRARRTILYHILHHIITENHSFRMAWVYWTTLPHPLTRTNGNNVDPFLYKHDR